MAESRAPGGGMQPRVMGENEIVVQTRSAEPTYRAIMRVVITVVASALALYLVYLLRTPLFYLAFATFIAAIVSAPVNRLSGHMPRGVAILLIYAGLILVPLGLLAILTPPAVRATSDLVGELPAYVDDVNQLVEDNEQLQKLDEDFDLTQKLRELAQNAASDFGDTASALADVGASLVSSLFAVFTTLVLSVFMVARGSVWFNAALRHRPPEQAEAIRRAGDRMASAISSYVGGALAQATLAGLAAFIVLSILGVPSPLALAVIVGVLDLIPLIGATIGAVIVGVITVFTDFPTVTIIWVVFAIAYQQFENYVIQPRIQSKAVQLDPFIIVVAALFGGALLGVIGALVAIPCAAAVQIGAREIVAYRRRFAAGGEGGGETGDPGPPDEGGEGAAAAPAPG
jgi:predicted PurR-regulated permease PerM